MRIAINASAELMHADVGRLKEHAAAAAEDGFSGWWLAQTGLIDALTVFPAVADAAPGIEFGTAVIPTFPRHPTMLAGQALTTQAVLGDRSLVLGIGLSHKPVIEEYLGMSFDKPIRHLIDYLEVLMPILADGHADYDGEAFTAHIESARPTDRAPSVMVAALGEQALRVTGRRTDGTILWMVGPRTIENHIRPRLTEAAAEADRSEPRIVCSLPVCVTDEAEAVRDAASQIFSIYGELPSYRAMLDREGVEHPGEVAVIGSEAEVTAQIADLEQAGTTDFAALEFGRSADEFARTRALLKSLL
ncbi:MAG: TIGR03564 family F420-dependent LLM class oxidoreductase [Actinobacteria bacterium]|nr:TIGR03564 family F420-dependent LLM class oxidoreductase [Actinomycetota bacterium]MBT3688027.1 TIGR03564 family F420-dependent LLM class oxidoreductase [Actinomycetota bacterium]MBT4036864.1 TIGR03564 family F420-dependent LLM class oxidoreductase [Actinomycetota bacterium]MBT4278506.1 TIGR03564 family F420-dependent LLM class oxidoreductase [Actinomycetota bacterium]MBT4343737.1 TIGR03564 family F420-dependent LLM class oxidoreductase [Actinomycetota bacterium]